MNRLAHAGDLGAAQGAAGLFVARHHVLRVKDLARFGETRVVGQRAFDARPVTDQQELERVVTPARKRGAFDHHAHAFIPAHRIDGDTR